MSRHLPQPTPEDRAEVAGAGQCAACRDLQVLRSPRSTFVRCARHDRDPSWPRYPRLPMAGCPGFVAAEPAVPGEPADADSRPG